MNRSVWLAAFAFILAPALAHAQQQGGGMMGRMMQRPMQGRGGMGGGMGAMGGGMMGMGGGMGGMGGGMMVQVRRAVKVELERGRSLDGHVELGYVRVAGDLGGYAILPDRIASIRFLKAAEEARGGKGNEPAAENNGEMSETHVKVITTTGDEIVGVLQDPSLFVVELKFGTLMLQTNKLRTITFTEGEAKGAAAGKGAKPEAGGHAAVQESDEPRATSATPHYHRVGNGIIVASPVGDRVTYYDLEKRQPRSVELSGTRDAPLEVTPIVGPNVVALAFKGTKITRIAVVDPDTGIVYPQDLKEPAKGQAMPIVGNGIAVYPLGRHIYAFSAQANRWDVAELPKGMLGVPIVGPDGASIEGLGHIFTFLPRTGKWEHIDVRAILDLAGAEKH